MSPGVTWGKNGLIFNFFQEIRHPVDKLVTVPAEWLRRHVTRGSVFGLYEKEKMPLSKELFAL
jgi:hypothetical protein